MRRSLGRQLLAAGFHEEAAAQLRWCLARKPDDRSLHEELIAATKVRLATNITEIQKADSPEKHLKQKLK